MKNTAIEIVHFQLNQIISDDELYQIVDELEKSFHSIQPGFLQTELAKDKDNYWYMIQNWENIESAKAASKKMMTEPSTESFRFLINPKNIKINYVLKLGEWCA